MFAGIALRKQFRKEPADENSPLRNNVVFELVI